MRLESVDARSAMKRNHQISLPRSAAYCLLLTAYCLLFTTACGSLYKVKPAVNAPLPDDAKESSSNLISVRAVPLLTDEESQDLFEANLPLAGILPVRVEIENKSVGAVDLKKARFSLRDSSGREWKNLSVKNTVKRVMKANGIYVYTPASKQEFLDGLNSHALNLSAPLNQNEKRQGILFFQTPKKEPVEKSLGLILKVEKLTSIELRLN